MTVFVTAIMLVPAAARAQRDTAVVADPRYAKGAVHRLFFGNGYRDLWTTPVRAPILDLQTFAGGLRPLSSGGGFQTSSLWFRGSDGHMYGFRGVVKLPGVLPVEVESTFVKDIVQDQISAGHPGAPAVVAPLLEAAGVLHTDPTLVILPHDAALDTFCTRFCGLLGFLERRAVAEPGRPGFAGADSIISSRRLFPLLRRSPDNLIDQRALLTARLMDVFLGDWDRHRGQWTWARFGASSPTRWVPIPEDRDQAFAHFDGLMLGVVRSVGAPFLVKFEDSYADIVGQTWNGRDVDRWFLEEPDRAVWDSIAAALQARLTDSVIEAAVRHLPDAWYALEGEQLARALKHRRDLLPREAERYYRMLAREAEVHATAADEDVSVDRLGDGRIRVSLARRDAGDAPYFTRTYQPHETHEVRIYLRGGADQVVARGSGPTRIVVRVIGDSTATVLDSSASGGVKRYDAAWTPFKVQHAVRISGLPQRPGAALDEPTPPRDWGARTIPLTWVSYGPDLGVFVGLGLIHTNFGFRRLPSASQWRLRAGWATGPSQGRAAIDGTIRFVESRVRAEIGAYASGIEVVRWNGVGNATRLTQPEEYYLVDQAQVETHARLVVPVGRGELRLGPTIRYSHTRSQSGRIIADSLPYGSANYGQAGLTVDLSLVQECCWRRYRRFGTEGDSIGVDSGFVATRALRLSLGGSGYPAFWTLDSAYAEIHGEASAQVTAQGAPLRPSLAVRAGGRRVFGSYPFTEAAFIGDASTVRLGRKNRYAGDAAAWGNVELRLALTRFFVILPGQLGIFGLADAGRVFVHGESSDRWHSAVGGGLWISFLRPANLLSVAIAKSDERTAVYLGAGFAF